jgi:uracil-DNA glycosylase
MALRDRGAEIESWLAARPPCPRCGRPALERKGGGSPDARLVIVATSPDGDALSPEGSAMLDKMLIHVLALERADVWVVEANPCAATADDGCRAAVLHQVTVLNPRAILGMGLRSPLGPPRRGEWTRFGEIDVLSTFHPHELLARPADKRAALDQLTELRRRL